MPLLPMQIDHHLQDEAVAAAAAYTSSSSSSMKKDTSISTQSSLPPPVDQATASCSSDGEEEYSFYSILSSEQLALYSYNAPRRVDSIEDDLSSFYSATPFDLWEETNDETNDNGQRREGDNDQQREGDVGLHREGCCAQAEGDEDAGSQQQQEERSNSPAQDLLWSLAHSNNTENPMRTPHGHCHVVAENISCSPEYEVSFVPIEEEEEKEDEEEQTGQLHEVSPNRPTPPSLCDLPPPAQEEEEERDRGDPSPSSLPSHSQKDLSAPPTVPSPQQDLNVAPPLPLLDDELLVLEEEDELEPSVPLEEDTTSSKQQHRSIFGTYWQQQPPSRSPSVYVETALKPTPQLLGMTLRLEMEDSDDSARSTPRTPRRRIFGPQCFAQPHAQSAVPPPPPPLDGEADVEKEAEEETDKEPAGNPDEEGQKEAEDSESPLLTSRRSSSSLRRCRYSGEFRREASDAELSRSVSFSDVDNVKVFEKPVEQYASENWADWFG